MSNGIRLLAFLLGEQRYALHLSAVERVIPTVETTPLPEGPEVLWGVVNLRGRIVPVMDIRRRFRLPQGQWRSTIT